jgi:integrase
VVDAIKGKKGLILSQNGSVSSVTAWRRSWESYCNQIERHLNGMQKRWYGKTKEHKLLLQAGKSLPAWKSFNVTPYDLRHSFVAWCRDNGVELNTVVSWMGHADATMVLHIYDEVSASRDKSEAKKLKKIAFGSQNGSQTETDTP